MAEYGKIFKRVWTSPRFEVMTDDAKLLLCYVFSCEHSNSVGLYKLKQEYIVADLQWTAKRLAKPFTELVTNGWIDYDESTSVILIHAWFSGDPPAHTIMNENMFKRVCANIDEIPRTALVELLITELPAVTKGIPDRYLQPLVERLSQRLPHSLQERFGNKETETETEIETETETEAPAAKTSEPPINRFNAWLKTEKGKSTFWTLSQQYSLPDGIVLEELANMRAWLIAKPKQGNKKEWPAFLNNWFKGCRRDMVQPTNPMTAEQEQAHYDSKRRSGDRTERSRE